MNATKALFVFPTPYEAQKVFSLFMGRRRMPGVGDVGIFELSGEKFAALVCGYASAQAAMRVEECIVKYNPANVVLCGFCGACTPELNRGQAIVDSDSDALTGAAERVGARRAKICACTRVAGDVEKETLARENGACAVDMESAFVKDLCRDANFVSVRVVSDPFPSGYFPTDFMNALIDTESGKSRPLAAAWELIKKPSMLPGLIKFAKSMKFVREIYGDFMEKLVFEIAKLH